jgi:hypothetical protein
MEQPATARSLQENGAASPRVLATGEDTELKLLPHSRRNRHCIVPASARTERSRRCCGSHDRCYHGAALTRLTSHANLREQITVSLPRLLQRTSASPTEKPLTRCFKQENGNGNILSFGNGLVRLHNNNENFGHGG